MTCKQSQLNKAVAGFSLVELAIVLIVIGVLSRTALAPLSAVIERGRVSQTAERLQDAREALIGHLISGGTLPCPAASSRVNRASSTNRSNSTNGTNRSNHIASAKRTTPHQTGPHAATASSRARQCQLDQGVLPASLGIAGSADESGRALDAWGQPLQYAVSLSSSDDAGQPGMPDWTTAGEVQAVGIRKLDADLELCLAASRGSCPSSLRRGDRIVAVIWSTGRDTSSAGSQSENQDGDQTFAVAAASINPDQPFDDQLVWLSALEAKYWLLRSDWLP